VSGIEGNPMPTATATENKKVTSDAPKRATLDGLLSKKPTRLEFTAALGDDGDELSFLFVALGARPYDALLTKHPPTAEQKINGALLAMVCVDPDIDTKGWASIWTADNWNRGEVSALFWQAVELCNQRVDINPTKAG
jgi:hypothetical protein